MADIFERTVGQQYAHKPDTLALIPKVLSGLEDAFIQDAADFKSALDFDLDRVFKGACGDLGPGMLNFVLKHIGTPGHPHKPVPAVARDFGLPEDAVTAENAVALAPPRFGRTGKGQGQSSPNFRDQCRAPGSVQWDGVLPPGVCAAVRNLAKKFTERRKCGAKQLVLAQQPVVAFLIDKFGVSPNVCRQSAIEDAAAAFDALVPIDVRKGSCYDSSYSMSNKVGEIRRCGSSGKCVSLLVEAEALNSSTPLRQLIEIGKVKLVVSVKLEHHLPGRAGAEPEGASEFTGYDEDDEHMDDEPEYDPTRAPDGTVPASGAAAPDPPPTPLPAAATSPAAVTKPASAQKAANRGLSLVRVVQHDSSDDEDKTVAEIIAGSVAARQQPDSSQQRKPRPAAATSPAAVTKPASAQKAANRGLSLVRVVQHDSSDDEIIAARPVARQQPDSSQKRKPRPAAARKPARARLPPPPPPPPPPSLICTW